MYFHNHRTLILEVLLSISCWSCGNTQPSNYQGSHHYSRESPSSNTGHIRAPHARGSAQGQHEHHHYVPHKPTGGSGADHQAKLLQDKQLLHDKEHLKEDMGEWLFKDGKEMSPAEMEFHYFKSHDYDNNSMLDGLEILQAISHILPMTEVETDLTSGGSQNHHHHHGENSDAGAKRAEMIRQRDEDFNYYVDLIDKVMDEDDLNKDGYLSYMEYSIGRRREDQAPHVQVAHKY